jgi:hypothetical protein
VGGSFLNQSNEQTFLFLLKFTCSKTCLAKNILQLVYPERWTRNLLPSSLYTLNTWAPGLFPRVRVKSSEFRSQDLTFALFFRKFFFSPQSAYSERQHKHQTLGCSWSLTCSLQYSQSQLLTAFSDHCIVFLFHFCPCVTPILDCGLVFMSGSSPRQVFTNLVCLLTVTVLIYIFVLLNNKRYQPIHILILSP